MAEAVSDREGLVGRVLTSLERLAEQAVFKDFLTSSAPDEGDLVLVNNSFVYRDTVKTTKNSKYIAGRLHKGGGVSSWGVVEWDHPLNVDWPCLWVPKAVGSSPRSSPAIRIVVSPGSTPTFRRTDVRASVSTTHPIPMRCAVPPTATDSPSIASLRSRCSTPTPTT